MGQESLAPRPLGTNHPRYTLVKDLNKGAQGFVQLCKDELTGELVAIKFIERGDKVTQYVEREIINHRSLCHPHVIQFKEVFLTPRHLGIAMEYAAGGDLFEYIMSRDKRLLEAHSRWFFQQLIVALDYCHKMGVANRDIKLENTLLDSNSPPLLKLCDFGYSKNSKIQSAPRSLVGTPAYLAPEVICAVRGKEYDGQAADVWSSGVMLYVMLVGGYPFERPEDKKDAYAMRAMYVRIQAADYRVPAVLKLSQNCQDLLSRMLVADPAQRITIPEIQRHPWYTQGLPVGVLDMNDHFEPVPEGVQSEEAIRAILDEARRPVGGPGIPMAIPVGNGAHPMTRDTLDELVDDALLNPHDDSDPEMLCDNPHRMRYRS